MDKGQELNDQPQAVANLLMRIFQWNSVASDNGFGAACFASLVNRL